MRRTYFLLSALVCLILLTLNPAVFGLFTDNASALNNTFTAAAAFPSPSVSPSSQPSANPSPSITPSASPSPSPVPSSSPSSGTTIVIEGNGPGSTNTVTINNTQNCTINQSNSSGFSFNINSSANSGGNTITGNTGSSTTTSGTSTSNVTVGVIGGSNNSNGCP